MMYIKRDGIGRLFFVSGNPALGVKWRGLSWEENKLDTDINIELE